MDEKIIKIIKCNLNRRYIVGAFARHKVPEGA